MSGIIKDLANNLDLAVGLTSAVITADANGAAIDLQQHNNGAVLFDIGISGDTLSGSVYIECELQESDASGSGYTACADADVLNTVTGTNTGTVAVINDPAEDDVVVLAEYTGKKRYIRGVINVTGTHTTGTSVAIINIQHNEVEAP